MSEERERGREGERALEPPLKKSGYGPDYIASIQLLEIDNNLLAGICTVRILPKVTVSFEFKIFSAHQFWFGPVLYKMRVFVRFIGYSRGVYSI